MPEHKNDKSYKRIFLKKHNFFDFMKKYLSMYWVNTISETDLQLLDTTFIQNDFKKKEADIVYRLNSGERNIIFYVLLELQSKVDYTMPMRLLTYISELSRKVFEDTPKKIRERKSFQMPCVVPVVLYNGAERWTAATSYRDYSQGAEYFGDKTINFGYYLLDINATNESVLLSTNTLIDNIFLLDKAGDFEVAKIRMKKVSSRLGDLSPDDRADLVDWLRDVLRKKLPSENTQLDQIIEYFGKGDGINMEHALSKALDSEIRKGYKEGELKATRDLIIQLKKMGVEREVLRKASGLSDDELEKLLKN